MSTDTTLEAAGSIIDAAATEAPPPVPEYMTEIYDWAYVSPAWVEKLDHNLVVRTLLFGNDQRLMRAYLQRIRPGMRVWQVAHVYGDLVRRAAQAVGSEGTFHLTDITPIQIAHAVAKLQDLPQARTFRADARLFPGEGSYDLICSFFLLHEVPDEWKHAIVDNMLRQLTDDGELIFVDYHKPKWWQPIGYLLRGINRLLEPFAEALWEREIASFASQPERFHWEKRTIFGGVYQIVRVTRRQP